MSASIYWEPVKEGCLLSVNQPSRFQETLRSLTGEFPCTLTNSHSSALRALATSDTGEKGWQRLAEAVDQYDAVRVWAVY